MEFVIAIVGSIVAKAVELTISPIKNHVKYLSNHQQNVETLKNRAERLKDARVGVQHSVDAAKRNGEEIEGDVDKWLSAVDKKIPELAEKVMEDEEKAKKKCFIGLCPNFWTRYKLSLKAEEEAKAVAELIEHGNFERVSYRAAPQGIVVAPVKGYEEFESRRSILNGIMEALKDDSVSVVGVHGMGGIGKTTLVKEIARMVKGKLFDSVVIATVTQAIDIEKIQNRIAELLGLKFEEQSTDVKALRLRERLKKEGRVLVVLDDIWGKVDIEDVGIPLGDEHKGCKLLLTSRELNVLSNGMDAQKNFPIGFLNEKEAWDLFKKKAGDCVESCDLKPTAMEVAKKCAGLPIAIATVAGALRNRRLFEWKNALRELERPSSSKFTGIAAAHSAIEWSFNYLESEEVKLTFLLCSVIGHNGFVEDLVRYTLGLGLFDGVYTMEEARNKVLTVVANLKASALLLDSYNDKRFDIHDVVWVAALAIASKDYRMLVLRDNDSKEWSDKLKMKSWSVISLRCPQIIANLPKEMECSGLSFFHMAYDGAVKISPNFFKQTEGIKALDLVGMQFPSLPESIIHLTDLRMLCLKKCAVDDITILGELKSLEVLNLSHLGIKELPKEMAQLTQLRLLDLSWCGELKIIPPNVLSSLSKLEELYMGESIVEWEKGGVVENERKNASLDELNNLSCLTTLYVCILDVQMIPKHRFVETLDRFRIFVGNYGNYNCCHNYESLKALKLMFYTNIDFDNRMKMLLIKTEDLCLEGLEEVKNVLLELNNGKDLPYLKRLHVKNGMHVQYIKTNKIGFSELCFIRLENLPQLVSFCSPDERCSTKHLLLFNKQTCHWITNLRSLIIKGCGKLEHLLSPSLAGSLVQLQCFKIEDCEALRDIILAEEIEEERKDVICFHRLNSLYIEGLSNLIFFSSGNHNIEFPLLKQLTIQRCPKLIGFISQSSNQSGMHALFSEKVAVPSLEDMNISGLSNLKMIFYTDLAPGSFQNLRKISLRWCGSVKNLFPVSIAKDLPQLEEIRIIDCGVEDIVSKGEGVDIILAEEIEEERKDVICFHRLNSLYIEGLSNLIFFSSGNQNIEFPLLKQLKIRRCPKLIGFISQSSNQSAMHALFSEKVAVPSLEDMNISGLSNLKMIFYNDLPPDSFQKLRKISLWSCGSLKNLFPVSIAKDLPQLEDLCITNCGVEEIVSKGEGVEEQPVRFEFPQVSSLEVTSLKNLKCFYEGQHTIVWPMLKTLRTDSSALLKIVASEHLRLIQGNEQAVLLVEEVIPKLEELKLQNFGEMDQFPPDLFRHIKVLAVSDGSGFSLFPFVRIFYNLDSLELFDFDFKHVVHCKGDAGTLPPIRNLKLVSAENLKHIWRKDSELDHILSNLQKLTVWHCDDLINITASSSSLQNLTTLNVSYCQMMTKLVTPSVLKSLVQLTTIKVEDCTKMTEIVGNEGDCHQTIVCKLKCLQLCKLESLTSFCPGYYNFEFPCLEELVVEDCPRLKIFSEGDLSTPQLQRIKKSRYHEIWGWSWTSDLNTAIQQLYTKEGGRHNRYGNFNISDTFPESIEIWTRNPQEMLGFKNFTNMQFYKCSSLKYIFTLPMLLSLNLLQRIEVKECSSMEQVVREEEEAMTHKFTFLSLRYITIESCSNLENFHLGSQALEFPCLSNITIKECPKMTAFSSSVSKESGDASENVVGEGSINDNNVAFFSNKVVIPCLKRLDLSSINIHKIWHHSSSPSIGYLRSLHVTSCHNLKYLLPSFLVKDPVQLEWLLISDCNMMEQVIYTDGLVAEHQGRNQMFFSNLRSLHLRDLPKLTSLCFENYFEFHYLAYLSLKNCPLLKTIISNCIPGDEPQIGQHVQASNLEVHSSSLLNEKVVFPSLKTLRIKDCDSLEEIIELQGVIADESQSTSAAQSIMAETETTKFVFPKLTNLELDKVPRLKSFYSRMHTTQWPSLKQMDIIECPKVHIFTPQCPESQVEISNQQPLFCVNELVIDNASICQIVQSEGLSDEERHTSAFYQLKELSLSQLPELTLKTFEPSLLSFKNLTTLEVSRCHGLINLIAYSTAKCLMLLEKLSIDDCEMIEEIIACEAEEIQGGIVFPKLKYLKLSCLPCLASFSLAHHSLEVPVLLMVVVTKCPQMRNFCQGDLSTPRLEQMHLTRDEEDELQWEGNLNTTIKHMFDEMNVQNSEVTEVTDQLPKLE
ncbi:hypothetical protein CXB51_024839 [Gossypium anomalum]|uniref:AAA+ ATPase domain-containing protein n=1 Tax=Gossypium anomalum TaxID=47600 RepID=A0A8J6CPV0_9ROSI|nr:hypothetical protein CXB51_024839 [Gossypium anomalum]